MCDVAPVRCARYTSVQRAPYTSGRVEQVENHCKHTGALLHMGSWLYSSVVTAVITALGSVYGGLRERERI
jgi:hypothetical protein